jgi:hypothetical protein
MNALGFFGIAAGAALCFLIGWVARGQKDKPVYIPETMVHDSKRYPHHLHDHDKPKK